MTAESALPSRKRQQTRERLMDAAYRLFAEEGVRAVSIEAIAEAAGFTRGAFYSNFESKDELFFALADRELSARLQVVREALENYLTPATALATPIDEGVAELLAAVFTTIPETRTWTLISREYELLALRDPQVAPQFLAHEQPFRAELQEVLTGAVAMLDRSFVLDPGTIIDLVLHVHDAAITRAILSGQTDVRAAARDSLTAALPTLIERLTTPN